MAQRARNAVSMPEHRSHYPVGLTQSNYGSESE